MEPEDSQSPQKPSTGGYGKRPKWQWILLYVIVAIVVYGLIYYVFIRDSSSSGGLGY